MMLMGLEELLCGVWRGGLQGYPSLGDVHSTVTVQPRSKWFEYGGERSGRFQVHPAPPMQTHLLALYSESRQFARLHAACMLSQLPVLILGFAATPL